MRHISNKKGICAHFLKERAKQIINLFLPHRQNNKKEPMMYVFI